MISSSMLPLFGGAKSAYASQMSLFGLSKPSGSAGNANLALAERIGSSQMLTQSDKTGLMRLMATVEQFGGSNKEGLLQKVLAIASMSEMLNSNKGVEIQPFNAADSLKLYWAQYQDVASNDAVRIAPESEIASLLSSLQAQLSA